MPFLLTSDFTLFPDNLILGPAFSLSAMDFVDHPSANGVRSFVNNTSGVRGLQWPHAGLEIGLPTAVCWARLHVGQFATPFTVEALDLSGAAVGTYTPNSPNTYYYLTLKHSNIASVRCLGGGNEATLVSIDILIV